jgi:transcriptional regulator with XRE-family HTH domain
MKGLIRSPEEMKFAGQLSDWIRSLRVNAGLTHGQLGEVAGVLPATQQRWERNESMPTPFQLFLLRSFARKRGQELPEL